MVVFPYIGAENIGICSLSAVLKLHNIETKLAFEPSLFDDTSFMHIPAVSKLFNYNERFANYIVSLKPTILAFSVFTMNYRWALDIAKRVKDKIDVITVFGGHHVQAIPEIVCMNSQVDYVILGEGEYALLELVQSIYSGKVDLNIQNLGYKIDSKVIINPVRPLIENLDALPSYDRELFAKYINYKDIFLYVCGRGCPYKCTFCANHVKIKQYPNKHKYVRFQSVDRCIEDLKFFKKKYNPITFSILDDILMVNKKWMYEFCNRYKNEIGVPYHAIGYPSLITEEIIQLLKETGCIFLQIGIQSLNIDNRKNILHRYESNQDIANCIDLCNKYDMGISVDYIFFPWEATEEIQLFAANFFHEHKPSRIACFYLTYLPSTEIVDYAMQQGYIEQSAMKNIHLGVNAYYHDGGELSSQKETMDFFNNFFNFFYLITIFPKSIVTFLFKIKAYKYSKFFPKTLLLVIAELILPYLPFVKRRKTLEIKRYFKYYLHNIKNFLFQKYE